MYNQLKWRIEPRSLGDCNSKVNNGFLLRDSLSDHNISDMKILDSVVMLVTKIPPYDRLLVMVVFVAVISLSNMD